MFSRREMPPTQPSSLVVIERDGIAELICGAESAIQAILFNLRDSIILITGLAACHMIGPNCLVKTGEAVRPFVRQRGCRRIG